MSAPHVFPSSTASAPQADDALFRKIAWRLLPLLCACYLFNYLDRTNVGYAQLQMKTLLGFSDAVFGLGASIFFLGYAVFEVPSNLLLARIGARATLLRILSLWGLASAAMVWVSTPTQFYVLRFLIGVFEAGFAPGVLYYLTLWFPKRRLAQATALFFMAYGMAPILAGPAAGAIMTYLDGVGQLHGWQWLFLLEGVPCVVLGVAVYRLLPNRPADATWLSAAECARVQALLHEGGAAHVPSHADGLGTAFRDRRVWVLGIVSFLVILGVYALAFWSPTMLKGMGLSVMQIGLYLTLPAVCGVAASIVVGRHSDHTGERRWHFGIAALTGASGLMLAGGFPGSAGMTVLCLALASAGISSAFTVLWAMPGSLLTGRGAAAGIAIISTVGGSAGMVAPVAVGVIKTVTGGFTLSLVLLSSALVLAAMIFVSYFRPTREVVGGAPLSEAR